MRNLRTLSPRRDAAVVPLYSIQIDHGGDAGDTLRLGFPSALAARREAMSYAGEMLQDHPDAFWASQPWRMTLTDETGATLLVLTIDCTTSAPQEDERAPGPHSR